MLKIKDIHKSFGKNEIFKGVDLSIDKGDVVVIIGPSGSGKTTFLRLHQLLETAEVKATFGDLTVDLHNISKTYPPSDKKQLLFFKIIICLTIKQH